MGRRRFCCFGKGRLFGWGSENHEPTEQTAWILVCWKPAAETRRAILSGPI